jgi:hypothetical protein
VPDPPAHPRVDPRAGRFYRVHRPMVRDWIVTRLTVCPVRVNAR